MAVNQEELSGPFFSDLVVAARKAKGLSQEAVARALVISVGTVRHWERERAEPGARHLVGLMDVLELDYDEVADALRRAPNTYLQGHQEVLFRGLGMFLLPAITEGVAHL